ncbi:MAG: stage II sporulation protein P [Clostridia bacterium]|nr:stage II sporulation protein P [Clostridia bacterium]
MILQSTLTLCVLAAQWTLCQPGSIAAFAEDSYIFTVEVNPDTPAPSETPSPDAGSIDTMLRVEVLLASPIPTQEVEKRILIYHTHTWEAYAQVEDTPYQETETWRTKDDAHNVIAVGRALAASLESLGFDVVHDTTAFEPPDLDDAYARSLDMLEERAARGEAYDLYIDLHRDAIASSSTIRKTVNIGGTDVARFMVLVGKGTTGGYAEKPDWEANYVIAEAITDHLNSQCEGLARDIKVKTGRFNQHIAPCCVLIECGMNTNTLQEVLSGVPYLAQAIADTLME